MFGPCSGRYILGCLDPIRGDIGCLARVSEPAVLAPYAKKSLGSRTMIKNVGQNLIKILIIEWVKSRSNHEDLKYN